MPSYTTVTAHPLGICVRFFCAERFAVQLCAQGFCFNSAAFLSSRAMVFSADLAGRFGPPASAAAALFVCETPFTQPFRTSSDSTRDWWSPWTSASTVTF